MKTYTVTQKGGYQVLRTFDKAEAEACLKEHESRSKHGILEKDNFYICEQGNDNEQYKEIKIIRTNIGG